MLFCGAVTHARVLAASCARVLAAILSLCRYSRYTTHESRFLLHSTLIIGFHILCLLVWQLDTLYSPINLLPPPFPRNDSVYIANLLITRLTRHLTHLGVFHTGALGQTAPFSLSSWQCWNCRKLRVFIAVSN